MTTPRTDETSPPIDRASRTRDDRRRFHARRWAFAACAVAGLYLGCSSQPAPNTPPTAPVEAKSNAASAQYGAPPPQAGYEVSTTNPTSPADAQAQLDAAEKQLQALVGTGPRVEPLASDGCEIACKALSSMRSATDHLCRLTLDEPARCQSAKDRVERATERVKQVCPACAEPPT